MFMPAGEKAPVNISKPAIIGSDNGLLPGAGVTNAKKLLPKSF